MDETRTEREQRIEIAGLQAKVVRLEARAREDRRHAQRKLELEIHLATSKDVHELEEHIEELKTKLAENDAVVDRLVIVMRRRGAEEDSLLEDMP